MNCLLGTLKVNIIPVTSAPLSDLSAPLSDLSTPLSDLSAFGSVTSTPLSDLYSAQCSKDAR